MPMSSIFSHIQGLNEAQRKAVEASMGHVLVSAGAGTGKTRVLILRFAHLVLRENVDPRTILAVTFTNKASQEMKNRLQAFFPVHSLWVGTFHGLGLRILRENAALIGRTKDFSVLDPRDQHHVMQKILKQREIKKVCTPDEVLRAISRWKQKLLLPEEIQKTTLPIHLAAYQDYQQHMKVMNCVDFDDLILFSLRLLQLHPEVRYSFSHLLVDEYQDINEMQYLWLKVFVDQGATLFCVGDDDQSIYGWRGSSVDKILGFSREFPQAEVVVLEDNYRSTPHILSAASHLISHNEARYGKTLRTHQSGGEKIHVQGLWDSGEEAAFVADQLLAYTRAGESLSTMAILVRTTAQTREFEERFTLQHIPYFLVGGLKFYDRMEVRDLIAYLRVLYLEADNLAFERAVGTPKRGIGPSTFQSLYLLVAQYQISLEQAAKMFCRQGKDGTIKSALRKFLEQLDQWREKISQMSPAAVAELVLQESGYNALWQAEGIQGETRLENLKELVKAMSVFASMAEFLEHVSLLADVTDSMKNEGIAVMTLHAAKGLEFDTVFLPGWEEQVFPHVRCVEESGKKGVEEERRLAYVGLTRAKKRSIISFCWNRRSHQGFIPSAPSRFINELPEQDILLSLKVHHNAKKVSVAKQVMHHVFGKGVVQSQVGHRVSVLFEHHGLKKVIQQFLKFL